MRTEDLDYYLPPDRIAQLPSQRREAARLLVSRTTHDAVEHRRVEELADVLRPGDLLVLNDTRVVPARFVGVRTATGGRVEGLFLGTRGGDADWRVLLQARGKLKPGERVRLSPPRGDGTASDEAAAEHELALVDQTADGSWDAVKRGPDDTATLLDRVGAMPLPPYIRRRRGPEQASDALDRERYQTVYARNPGSVAAPTAGLHLTDALLDRLRSVGVEVAWLTLHVGRDTFQPVRTESLEAHPMHCERFTVPAETLRALRTARHRRQRIIPVGTTCVRAMEALPEPLPEPDSDHTAETDLLIQPGFHFRFTDGLLTNFHLPRSTLLALVAARAGLERTKRLYRIAVDEGYRFYSYGDAMLLLPD